MQKFMDCCVAVLDMVLRWRGATLHSSEQPIAMQVILLFVLLRAKTSAVATAAYNNQVSYFIRCSNETRTALIPGLMERCADAVASNAHRRHAAVVQVTVLSSLCGLQLQQQQVHLPIR